MNKTTSHIFLCAALIAGAVVAFLVFGGGGRDVSGIVVTPRALEWQTNDEGGVSVVAAPRGFSSDQSVEEFEVTFSTHSIELDADIAANAFLVDDEGNRYAATAWDGDPPGGHHRSGILRFNAVSPRPERINLIISNVGGVGERMFVWDY